MSPFMDIGTGRGGARGRSGPYAARRRLLLAGLLLAALVVIGRSADLQVLEGSDWLARARDQQSQRLALPAPRGTVYDRNGVPLASSRDAFRVAVAPHELADRDQAQRLLRDALGLSAAQARRIVTGRRRWVPVPGEHDAVVRDALEGVQGVYLERVQKRHYPHGELALALVGRVGADGAGATGLELEFDSLLSGRPGAAVVRRDARGHALPGAMLLVEEPVAGHDVYLTIDHELQEIAHEALRDALARTSAAGGDLLMTDPLTGEVLAAVSARAEGTAWTAVTEPYEPGSTLKPFLVASLLAEGRAALRDSVFAEEGRWVEAGRTLSDVHPYGWLTVSDALRVSSNIAMAKLASRLDAPQQYRYLRDFGFGTPTGIAYPSESSGLLRRPGDWSRYSSASLAMGYEIAVTPLQMTLAYGALANGGVLMEPMLVREVRRRDGHLLDRREPRPIRRVVASSVAERLRPVLVDVVQDGTGQEASLSHFRLAGKTGTARATRGGVYEQGAYTASFAGFFPADDPQLVILVKLDRPQGSYYGGSTAAPVTRATLEAALAARGIQLDPRSGSPDAPAGRALPRTGPSPLRAALPLQASAPAPRTGGPFVLTVNAAADLLTAPRARVAIPSVAGLPMRDAAALLHRHGLRVRVEGHAAAVATEPSAGTRVAEGALVVIRGGGTATAAERAIVLARSSTGSGN